jgi:nucleotide-binding universal stress UspA family protein
MKTILVPTDFSDISKNAALYAIELGNQLKAAKIILYNAYQAPVVTEPTMPVMQMLDIDTLKKISEDGMKLFKSSLQTQNSNKVDIEEINEFAVLPNAIDEVCARTGADLIVMGITGASRLEEVLIGSTAISVVKNTKIPVIIIPPIAKCHQIKQVMLACDYKKVEETTPLEPIKKLLEATNAKLFVLNVSQKSSTDKSSQEQLLSLLKSFNPEFHTINTSDFVGGINDFVEANNIDVIITIPKKHGLFEGLFKESHTKQLAFHSHVPLMCIHEEDL